MLLAALIVLVPAASADRGANPIVSVSTPVTADAGMATTPILVAAGTAAVADVRHYPGGRGSPGGYTAELSVVPEGGSSGTQQLPIGSPNAVSPAATAGSCGWVGYQGTVKYTNYVGVTLWTYRSHFGIDYCNYTVTGVEYLFDEPVDTCCNWGWHGNVTAQHGPIGGANIVSYTKGHFANCLPWPVTVCEDKFPWVQLQINGNGNLTGFNWGIG